MELTEYKYETHLHTSETSKCGLSSGVDLARLFKKRGYAGIFVTDHFLGGNTSVPRECAWDERIEMFCHGFEVTAREGRKLGLDVFFGWEYSYGWAHFLTYGLSKDWLLAKPDMLSWDLLSYFDQVHSDGGFIVHAHPFREGVDIVQLVPGKVDAIEVLNPGRPDASNQHALDFAISFGLPQTAGGDVHSTGQKRLCGIACHRRFKDARDYMTALKSGEVVIFDDQH